MRRGSSGFAPLLRNFLYSYPPPPPPPPPWFPCGFPLTGQRFLTLPLPSAVPAGAGRSDSLSLSLSLPLSRRAPVAPPRRRCQEGRGRGPIRGLHLRRMSRVPHQPWKSVGDGARMSSRGGGRRGAQGLGSAGRLHPSPRGGTWQQPYTAASAATTSSSLSS